MSHTRRQAIQLMGVAAASLSAAAKKLDKRSFGKTRTGEAVDLFIHQKFEWHGSVDHQLRRDSRVAENT